MVKFTLFLVRLLRKPLEWMDADFNQLEIILETKLTVDFRRGISTQQSSAKKKQTFGTQLIVYSFIGIFVTFGFITIHNLLLNFTIAYAVIMVMMSTTLITEFTSVLFDDRDNHILLVRPISNRTLLLSRLLHIQFYIMYIALALSVGTVVAAFIKFGIVTALFFFVGVGLLTWITLLITTLFYLLVSKVVNGERFKDIINYVQIILTVVVMGGYQFLPRIMEVDALKNHSMSVHAYTFLIPPAWLAGFVQLSKPAEVTAPIILLALLAFIVALVGGVLMVRFLSGGFTSILSQSSENEVKMTKAEPQKDSKSTRSFSRLFCVSELENAGWKMVMSITGRDRKFKQAIYPMYGFMFVMAFAFMRPDLNNLSQWFEQLKDSQRYLMFIFMGVFTTTSITQIRYTDTPEAGWVYRALPLTTPGHILSGAVKAMLIKFFVPMFSILTVTVVIIWGIHLLPLMLLGATLIITSTLITLKVQNTPLPFTETREMQQKGSNFLKAMFGMLSMVIVVGLVYLVSLLPVWSACLLAIPVLFFNSLFYKSMRQSVFEMA